MEMGMIERSIEIDASPEIVFDVITSPNHLKEWWPDEALFVPEPGATGHLVFGDRASGDASIPNITIIAVDPPRRFSFRWLYPDDQVGREGNSLIVIFELDDIDGRTLLRMTETGFRDKGWEVSVLEEQYRLHEVGWDRHLARLVAYVSTVPV